ncbi:lonely Cys domain-containing protein [Streptomyces sp. NPDC057717]|uniref:lonely Cys domain-containing protein n=1 Tax=Streptomyces sp. NPDC057717 TaxID=3346224 RepID=UPI00368893E0
MSNDPVAAIGSVRPQPQAETGPYARLVIVPGLVGEPVSRVLSEGGEEHQCRELVDADVTETMRAWPDEPAVPDAPADPGMPVAIHPSESPGHGRGGAVVEDPFDADQARRWKIRKLNLAIGEQSNNQTSPGAAERQAQAARMAAEIRQLREALRQTDLRPFLTGPDAFLREGLEARAKRIRELRGVLTGNSDIKDELATLRTQAAEIRTKLAQREASPHTQRMVPSLADVNIAKLLVSGENPEAVLGRMRDEISNLSERRRVLDRALQGNPTRHAPTAGDTAARAVSQLVDHRLPHAQQDLWVYQKLAKQQTVWRRVDETQAVQLVMAERRAQLLRSRDLLAASDRLRNTRVTARLYPLPSGEMEPFLEHVHKHLAEEMSLVSNVRLDSIADGRSLLDALAAGPEVAVGDVLARAAGAGPVKDPRERSLSAALVSKEFQKGGIGSPGSAAIHWTKEVRQRTVHTLCPDDVHTRNDPGHGATLSSLYPLLAHGDPDAVRLALAEATLFRVDLELRRRFAAGRPATDAHFGALIHGDLRWSDVQKVVLTFGDQESKQKAKLDRDLLKAFAKRHRLGFGVSLEPASAVMPTGSGSGQDPANPVSTVLMGGTGRTAQAVGRDYTPLRERPAGGPPRLATGEVSRADLTLSREQEPDFTLQRFRAPWTVKSSAPPFFVMAQGGHDRITAQLGDGTTAQLSPKVFADLLARDPELRRAAPDTPVVLLVPFGGACGLELPRLLAARTGRVVWSASGPLEVLSADDGKTRRIAQFMSVDQLEPIGKWIVSQPSDLRWPGGTGGGDVSSPGVVRTIDGDTVLDTDVVTHTIIGSDRQSVGRSSHSLLDQATRESAQAHMSRRTRYTESVIMDDALFPEGENELPWAADIAAGRTPYFFNSHGSPESVTLGTVDERSVRVDGSALGGFLRRRPSLSRLDQHNPIVLVACSTGKKEALPTDLLVAQRVAEETRRVVYAPTVTTNANFMLVRELGDRRGNWTMFEPGTALTVAATPVPPIPATSRSSQGGRSGEQTAASLRWPTQATAPADAADGSVANVSKSAPQQSVAERIYAVSRPGELTARDGSVLDVRVVQGPGNRFAEALAEVLGQDERRLPGLSREPGKTFADALRRTLAAEVTEADLVLDGPLPTAGVMLSLDAFGAVGLNLSAAQRTQAELLGGSLPLADAELKPHQQVAVLLRSPEHWDDAVTRTAAAVAARILTVGLDLVDTRSGAVTRFHVPGGGLPVTLATDGDRFQAALPRNGAAVPPDRAAVALLSTAQFSGSVVGGATGPAAFGGSTPPRGTPDTTGAGWRNPATSWESRTITDFQGRVIRAAPLSEGEQDRTQHLLGGLAKAKRFRSKSAEPTAENQSWEASSWQQLGVVAITSGKGKQPVRNSDPFTETEARLRVMEQYAGAAEELTNVLLAQDALRHQAGAGSSRDADRISESEERLTAAEARFDEAERGMVDVGLGDLSGRGNPRLPKVLSSLPPATFHDVMARADALLGRPGLTIGHDQSAAAADAQWAARVRVASELAQGNDDAARDLAPDLSQEAGFRHGGLVGGALVVAGQNVTGVFQAKILELEDSREHLAREEERAQRRIKRADKRLAEIKALLEAMMADREAEKQQILTVSDRSEQGFRREEADLEAMRRDLAHRWPWMPPAQRVAQQNEIAYRTSGLANRSGVAHREMNQRRADWKRKWEQKRRPLDDEWRKVSEGWKAETKRIRDLRARTPRDVLSAQRAHLDNLINSFANEVLVSEQRNPPRGGALNKDEIARFHANRQRIQWKLKKLIAEPTGLRGYQEIIDGTLKSHPEYGAKMHNVKVNNYTELARGIIGWVEAKKNRHVEKELAQRVEREGEVERLIDVLLPRILKKIDELPQGTLIKNELASGRSDFEPGRWLGTYLYHRRPEELAPHLKHLESAVWRKGGVAAVLRDPEKFGLSDKMMVLHDLFEYFGPARHTPKTQGTNLLPADEVKYELSTIRVDKEGHRIRASQDRAQNPLIGPNGTKVGIHPSTRNEQSESTRLARAYQIPVWSGQSFTAMRMFRLADWVGASRYEVGAVAWGIFTFWRLHFNHTTEFAYHTLHEVLDIAQNFGVSYSLFDRYAGLDKITPSQAVRDAERLAKRLMKKGKLPIDANRSVTKDEADRMWRNGADLLEEVAQVQRILREGNRGEARAALTTLLTQLDRVRRRFHLDATL